jgi:hypothetical protein
MNKKLILILFSVLYYFISGCENPVEDEDFPYEMKLVVRGIIEKNKLIKDIYIGRTLPVAVPFDAEFAKVKDAVGTVIVNGVSYPLRHTGNGLYTTDSLIAREGNRYYLLVRWQDKSANAETTVPRRGDIASLKVIKSLKEGKEIAYMQTEIRPFSDEVYGANWVSVTIAGAISSEAKEFGNVTKPAQSSNEVLKVESQQIPAPLLTSSGNLGVRLYTFDKDFYHYFISQGSSKIPDAIFGQPGGNVRWNIKGDGIGMFIGRIDTLLVIQ